MTIVCVLVYECLSVYVYLCECIHSNLKENVYECN